MIDTGVIYDDYDKIFDEKVPMVDSSQVGGTHYVSKTIQPWDFIVANKLGYLEGNVIKYVSRYQEKGGLEDLRKAKHYLEKLLEVKTNECIQEITGSKNPAAKY
jgi:hypothetical protein